MSIESIVHVLSLKVGDSTRKLVLLGHANHAHKDGTSSWASIQTIAEYADCSPRTAQRHTAALVADGLLREGDQRLVAHLRADRRPIVYDVAMSERDQLTWRREAVERMGRRSISTEQGRRGVEAKVARGDTLAPREDGRGDSLSPRQATPAGATRGDINVPNEVTPVTERGDTGVTQTVLEPSLEPSMPPAAQKRARRTDDEQQPVNLDARRLVAEWIDHCVARPPGRVVGHVAKLVDEMLVRDRIDAQTVRNGLAAWHRKGNQHPSTLPSFVNAAAQQIPGQRVRETAGSYRTVVETASGGPA